MTGSGAGGGRGGGGGGGDSLSGDLDELLEELHPLVERGAQTHLGDHPQLGLVEAAQEQVQVGRGLLEAMLPERVVDQLVLSRPQKEGA